MIEIPGKTFLCGEYIALKEGPSLVITTTPCFQLTQLTKDCQDKTTIHADSPAGRWMRAHSMNQAHFFFEDPYQQAGGLGASTAQFLAVYCLYYGISIDRVSVDDLLKAYQDLAWTGVGTPPSGYDLLAQSQDKIVHIDKSSDILETLNWPFDHLTFCLIRTGKKIATHHHLETIQHERSFDGLHEVSSSAISALKHANDTQFTEAVNRYQQHLEQLGLSSPHTLEIIQSLTNQLPLLAAKGCGALGADIILLIYQQTDANQIESWLTTHAWSIIAKKQNLYVHP